MKNAASLVCLFLALAVAPAFADSISVPNIPVNGAGGSFIVYWTGTGGFTALYGAEGNNGFVLESAQNAGLASQFTFGFMGVSTTTNLISTDLSNVVFNSTTGAITATFAGNYYTPVDIAHLLGTITGTFNEQLNLSNGTLISGYLSNVTLYPAPEPGTLVLIGTGMSGIVGLVRWKLR